MKDSASAFAKTKARKMERILKPSKKLRFDLIIDKILHLLPAKSLVRFISACKAWYYLIKSPQFIETHHKVNRSDTKGQKILILGKHCCYVLANLKIIQHIKLDFYTDFIGYWNTPIESCNGLIFIPIRLGYDREYLLWNPSIGKSKKLDSKVHGLDYEKCDRVKFNHAIFGLGFHESSHDHRVVRIRYVIDDRIGVTGQVTTEVDVYSVCTNSWRKVDSSPDPLIGSSMGIFVNGIIHWLATTRFTKVTSTPEDDHYESLLLFDFIDEGFKEMILPKYLHCTVTRTMAFNAFKGSLAAIVFEVTPNSSMFVLWVMADYGLIESWTKKIKIMITDAHIERWPLGILRRGILVYWEKDSEKLFLSFIDVDSGEVHNIKWSTDPAQVMDFMETLVLF